LGGRYAGGRVAKKKRVPTVLNEKTLTQKKFLQEDLDGGNRGRLDSAHRGRGGVKVGTECRSSRLRLSELLWEDYFPDVRD